jgi:Phage integrase, N-terminal SAM-like domain
LGIPNLLSGSNLKKTREKLKKEFASKQEAKLAAEEAARLIREGYEQTDESLKSYLETWLEEHKKGTLRKNTYELHKQNIKKSYCHLFSKCAA